MCIQRIISEHLFAVYMDVKHYYNLMKAVNEIEYLVDEKPALDGYVLSRKIKEIFRVELGYE